MDSDRSTYSPLISNHKDIHLHIQLIGFDFLILKPYVR